MNSTRQLLTALLYALVSVVLVVGGLSLAMAEGGLKASYPTAKPSATLLPSSTPVPSASPAAPVPASSTPIIVYVTATPPAATTLPVFPTQTSTLRIYSTATTRSYYPTAVRCGPYYGWVKSYVVQQGDTLFHISTLYQTTVPALQTANCLQSTFIYPGEMLWVPNVPTITPGVTLIPTFATPTIDLSTLTPYVTETATPTPTVTDTPIPDP